MKTRIKILGAWLLIAVLTGGAFLAGEKLRATQGTYLVASSGASVQTTALLKLTPELLPVTPGPGDQGPSEDRELVGTVLKLLKTHYVEPITAEHETAMARGAVRGMLESLDDPDSRFLDPTEEKLLADAAAGRLHGIGAVLALKRQKVGELDTIKLIVVTPMPGSPAEKANVKPGDSVTHIDGKWIARYDPFKEANLEELAKAARNKEIDWFTYHKSYEAAYNKLKESFNIPEALQTLTSKSSGEISLRVERAGQKEPIDLKLNCGKTEVDPVISRTLRQGIVYIRISQFNKRAIKEFAAEMERAQAARAKALVLDLRGNPGGLMDAAANIAGKITGGGVMAQIRDNSGLHPVTAPRTRALSMPVAVLVNSGTASVAELVAGTLRDRGTATIVGAKTFGDGLTQTPLLLRDGSAAILTTGKMLTAKGFDFNGKGLQPDRAVPEDESRGDTQLEEAEKIVLAKLGRA